MFSPYLQLWKLRVDGSPIVTNSGQLLPVQWHGQPAILKIAVAEEEKLAAGLMTWWNGASVLWIVCISYVRIQANSRQPDLAYFSGDK